MQSIIDVTRPILTKYGVKKAALFGSYVAGNHTDASDVDIIIQPPAEMGLEFVSLKQELEDALQKPVDLVSYNGLSKHLKQYVVSSQRPIL
jgi:predicted nucleotidyltransferase